MPKVPIPCGTWFGWFSAPVPATNRPIRKALSAASSHARDNPPRSKPSTMRLVMRFLVMGPASLFPSAVAEPSLTLREGKWLG